MASSVTATQTTGLDGNGGHGWRNTILAGTANYIDAGSIVAGSVALALWDRRPVSPGGVVGAVARSGSVVGAVAWWSDAVPARAALG